MERDRVSSRQNRPTADVKLEFDDRPAGGGEDGDGATAIQLESRETIEAWTAVDRKFFSQGPML